MPIDLNKKEDLETFIVSAAQASASPKTFDRLLTGNGKSASGFFDKASARLEDFIRSPLKLNGDLSRIQTRYNLIKKRSGLIDSTVLVQHNFDDQNYAKPALSRAVLPTLSPQDELFHLMTNAASNVLHLPLPFESLALFPACPVDKSWTLLDTKKNQPFSAYARAQVTGIYRVREDEDNGTGSKHKNEDICFTIDIFLLLAPKSGVFDAVDYVRTDLTELQDPAIPSRKKGIASVLGAQPGTMPVRKALLIGTTFDHLITDKRTTINTDQIRTFLNEATGGIDSVRASDLALPFETWIKDVNLHDVLMDQALRLHNRLVPMTIQHLRFIDLNLPKKIDQKKNVTHLVRNLLILFTHLESLKPDLVPTADFNKLYQEIKALSGIRGLSPAQTNQLTATHLRLMLAQNLSQLDLLSKSNLLYRFKPKDPQVTDAFRKRTDFSIQQKALLLTTDPLTLGAAGAGSGKSHTLVGRLDYLQKQGEDMAKVLVLSFTNVAADNIKQRYPRVKSVTLGNLFNQIYQATFPKQVLSTPTTLVNTLALVNPKNPMFSAFNPNKLAQAIAEFRAILSKLDAPGFKRVNLNAVIGQIAAFIANHFAAVVALLDAVGQTTLDLQPIIIHFLLLNRKQGLVVPKDYQDLNFIITDESQDISTFEYILLVTLTLQYQANLMIVGDGSQTLYEFRNSDPKFINAIESSGIFKTYKLTTNYRSKQAILTYANQFLRVIDANKYAKIQLESAQFQSMTHADFDQAVQVFENDADSLRKGQYEAGLTVLIENDPMISNWIVSRLKKNEQIAVLSHTHAELDAAVDALEHLLQTHQIHKEVTTITPNRKRAKTLISQAVRRFNFAAVPIDAQHASRLIRGFRKSVIGCFKNPKSAFVPSYVDRTLQMLTTSAAYQTYVREIMAGRMPRGVMDSYLIRQLLNEEIRVNAVSNYLNKEVPRQDYDKLPIIASTIHSAKGLEFTHTLVIYNEAKKAATSQENLRLFMVALTRAKESELIINTHKAQAKNKASRVVTSDLSGMFQTPMSTALLRCQETLDAAQTPSAQIAKHA